MKTAKNRIVWRCLGEQLGIPSTQDPARVYDCSDLSDKKYFYQALLQTGGVQVFYSKDDLLKAYPHININ